MRNLLICSPNKITDATIERTIAAAAEKPFMMLSVYFTTTDVYRPPTLAKTESTSRAESDKRYKESKRKVLLPQDVILTYYKEHPRCVTKEESFLHDPLSISHVNTDQGDYYAGQVHLNVSHPQGCLWALQHFLKVHTLK